MQCLPSERPRETLEAAGKWLFRGNHIFGAGPSNVIVGEFSEHLQFYLIPKSGFRLGTSSKKIVSSSSFICCIRFAEQIAPSQPIIFFISTYVSFQPYLKSDVKSHRLFLVRQDPKSTPCQAKALPCIVTFRWKDMKSCSMSPHSP